MIISISIVFFFCSADTANSKVQDSKCFSIFVYLSLVDILQLLCLWHSVRQLVTTFRMYRRSLECNWKPNRTQLYFRHTSLSIYAFHAIHPLRILSFRWRHRTRCNLESNAWEHLDTIRQFECFAFQTDCDIDVCPNGHCPQTMNLSATRARLVQKVTVIGLWST